MHEVLDNMSRHQDIPTLDLPIVTSSDGSIKDTVDVVVGSQTLQTDLVTQYANVDLSMALERQEVHPSKNIQLGVELWERVREYDARSAAEASAGLLPVLTRNQKQKIKMKHVLAPQQSKSRARGDSHSSAQ
jgi:hypothetical protein